MKYRLALFLFVWLRLIIMPVLAQPESGLSLQKYLMYPEEKDFIAINMRLNDQVDAQWLFTESRKFNTHKERAAFVIKELQAFAQKSQAPLISLLESYKDQGIVYEIRPIWIVNMVHAKVKPEILDELMQRKDLARIDYDKERQLIDIKESESQHYIKDVNHLEKNSANTWNVDLIGAPDVWEMGYTGEDVVVAVFDTGVNANHTDMQGRMWEHPDYPYHGYNFHGDNYDTSDLSGHGTHCAGTVVGTGVSGMATGVAPGAQIMVIKVLGATGGGSEANTMLGLQFAVSYGARILSMSMGWQHQWGPDRTGWRIAMNNALSAGVIASVSAGNEGIFGGQPAPNNIRTPGDCPAPWTHPDQPATGGNSAVVTIGSTTISDNISGFSSYGPVTWQNIDPFNDYPYNPGVGLIGPDVLAPGSDVISLTHNSNTGYTIKSGTSMAAPAVSGLMALMISKNPNLLPEEISQILEETALPFTDQKANRFGAGRIDAVAALQATPDYGIVYKDHSLKDISGQTAEHISPGEVYTIDVSFANPTVNHYQNASVDLSVESAYVSVLEGQLFLGDFEPGDIVSFEDAFVIEVAENISGSYIIEFILEVKAADESKGCVSYFKEMAHAPLLEFSTLVINDASNHTNNLLPGKDAEALITVYNNGQLPSDSIIVSVSVSENWITLLTYEPLKLAPVDTGEAVDLSFMLHAAWDAPPETNVEIVFQAISGPYTVVHAKQVVVNEQPFYTNGDIPTTIKNHVTTESISEEPGQITVNIPEQATITSVDVHYAMTSINGAWISEQRSYLSCITEGGAKETQIYSGMTNAGGTHQYQRTGLTIANNVQGGGPVTFELHAFRTWGGEGSNTNYIYVPDSTWKVIVYYELPGIPVTFQAINQYNLPVNNANIRVNKTSSQTNESGHTVMMLPEGRHYLHAEATSHRGVQAIPFDITSDDDHIDVFLLRVYEATFSVTDQNNNNIDNAQIILENQSNEPGQYFFDDLESGIYNYLVKAEGYLPQEGSFIIEGDNVFIEVVLSPDETSVDYTSYPSLLIYPNPMRDMITVDFGSYQYENLKLSVYDLSGNLHKQLHFKSSESDNLISINLANIHPGSYIFVFHTSKHTFTKKIFKY